LVNLLWLTFTRSKWIQDWNGNLNENYDNNIHNLIRCQFIIRNYLQRRKWKIMEHMSLPICLKDIVLSYT